MKLYNYFRSSASYRVRIALEIKELDYEYIPVHLLKEGGEQYKLDYSKLNPMNQVPSLKDGDFYLAQSLPIIEYLDEKYPESPLFPRDIEKKARVREFCEIINSGMQPLQNLKTLQSLDHFFKPHPQIKTDWVLFWLKKGFEALEKRLEETSGNYSFGNDLTAADCFLVPQVFSSLRFSYPIDTHANVHRVYQNLIQLKTFQKAKPENQPDFS